MLVCLEHRVHIDLVSDRLDMNITMLLDSSSECLGTDLVGVNESNLSFITIENLSDLLEGRTLGLDVEEGDEKQFGENPNL